MLARVNARNNPITYDEVLRFDINLQQHMRRLHQLPGSQYTLLVFDMFFLRSLMVLHRRHALDKEAPSLYPESYRQSLQASLAVSRHHVGLYDMSGNLVLLGRPYMLDSFAPVFTSCIYLLQGDSEWPPPVATSEYVSLSPDTAVRILRSSLDLLAKEQSSSLCFRTGYSLLHAVFQLVPRSD
jgi:hypothetical protein